VPAFRISRSQNRVPARLFSLLQIRFFGGKTAFTGSLQGFFRGHYPPFSACILYPQWAVPFPNLWFNSTMNTKLSIENTETREQPVPAHSLWESQLVSKAFGAPFEQLMRAHNIPLADAKKKKPRPASKTAQTGRA
jgi:hypothetical protein